MTNILIIILLSLLLFTSPLFGQSSESGVLYLWETSSDLEWKTFGNNDLQPRYKGEIKNGEPVGIGTLTYFNGNKYLGEWKDGKENGRGTFTWSDGRKYTGEFRDGTPEGQGTYTFADGTENVGEWKDVQQKLIWKTKIEPVAVIEKKLRGVLSYRKENARWGWYDYGDEDKDGKYVGEIENMKPNGSGTYIYGRGKWKGDKYEGEWKDGEFHGQGTLTRSNGHKLIGEWKNYVSWNITEYNKDGKIIKKYVDGVEVVVEVLIEKKPVSKEKKERGILFRDTPRSKWESGGKNWFSTGDWKTQGKYEGEILNGVPDGQGTYTWHNVNKYVGQFKKGLFDGQGTYYTFPSGVKVEGEFRKDKEWNTIRSDKDGNIIGKYVKGKIIK